MRIISDYKDFYDCIQKYGQDDGLIYLRKEKIIEKSRNFHGDVWHKPGLSAKVFTIGFAGKLYICVYLNLYEKDISAFCYKIEDVDKFVNSNFRVRHQKHYWEGKKEKYYWRGPTYPRHYYTEIFDGLRKNNLHLKSLFEEHNCPIFINDDPIPIVDKIFENVILKINCRLDKYEFYRVLDPQTAYQNLYMFLSNKASPEGPIPCLSDLTMRDIKGFDKYSFKKDKQ
jgi:hypothetical protein